MKLQKKTKEKSVDVITTNIKKKRFSIEKIDSELERYDKSIAKLQEKRKFYRRLKNKYDGK